jgi:hypothetical protein
MHQGAFCRLMLVTTLIPVKALGVECIARVKRIQVHGVFCMAFCRSVERSAFDLHVSVLDGTITACGLFRLVRSDVLADASFQQHGRSPCGYSTDGQILRQY